MFYLTPPSPANHNVKYNWFLVFLQYFENYINIILQVNYEQLKEESDILP